MIVNIDSGCQVIVYDDEMNKISTHWFPNIENAIAGKDFIVVQLKGGWVEVYDNKFHLISSDVFLNLAKIRVNDSIIINYRNGQEEFYDKQFNFQYVRYC